MRKKFDEQLADLHQSLIKMGRAVEYAIGIANEALINRDCEKAERAIAYDAEIDNMERDIESQCLKLILQQQPVAGDLRLISAILKMITDLERVGDHSADISEITIMMGHTPFIKKLEHIPRMAGATQRMVSESIQAFVNTDLQLAKKVVDDDDEVDELFVTVKKELINAIRSDIEKSDQAIDLLMIAKYFERIGDHATNIAEWVIFSVTGEHYEGHHH